MTERRRRSVGDPYGLLPSGSFVAPALALVGLAVVAFLTVSLFSGRLPFVFSSGGGGAGGGVTGEATAAPSNVVIVPRDPRADVPGSIVYAKQGSIWVQSGAEATQLTTGGNDSMPSWSPDGKWIYFIRTVAERAIWPGDGGLPADYWLKYPLLMRMAPDGSDPAQLASGRFTRGKYGFFFWIREPTPDPADPNQVAVVSDGPDPFKSDVVLQVFDVATGKFSVVPGTREAPPLGHQDPAWRPDGGALLYVRDDRDGQRGTPSIWRWDPATKKSSALTGPGYLAPSWSPDGKYVAATKTSAFGTDVVVLDASNGAEVLRVTTDGSSWSPAWSPGGAAIAYLHVKGGIVDLRMAVLGGSAPAFSIKDSIDLTSVSGLDAASRPSWYIPAEQLPPSPSPAASAGASTPASPSPSP